MTETLPYSWYSLAANWKVAVENYLECYHCAVAHPGFTELVDVSPENYRLERHPTFASHYARFATAAPRASSTSSGRRRR